jgi:hypothetical protein
VALSRLSVIGNALETHEGLFVSALVVLRSAASAGWRIFSNVWSREWWLDEGRGTPTKPQTRSTSRRIDHSTARTSLHVASSMPFFCMASMASSMTVMNSCSLMFMPLCVATMSLPV